MWNATCTFPFFNSVLLSILLQSVSFNVMMTAAMLVIKVEAFHQICLKSVGLDIYCENTGTECNILVYDLYSPGKLPPPPSYVKVNIAATYSEEKKDLDLVVLFHCLSRRCNWAERLKFRAACQ